LAQINSKKYLFVEHSIKMFIITIFSLGYLSAQTSGKTDPIELLLKNNRSVRAAVETYQAALKRVETKGVLPDPMIENSTFILPIETRNGPMENQIMLGQKFPLWGKLKRERLIAELQAKNAEFNLQASRIKAVFRMNRAWANYLKITRSLKILEQYQAELESFRRVALTQYSTGTGKTQHPILKLQIEMSLIESRINFLQSDLETVSNELQNLFDGSFTPSLFNIDWDLAVPERSARDWVELADRYNPVLLRVRNNVTIANITKELAKRKNYPDLVTGVTYTSVGPTSLGGAPSAGADGLGVKVGLNLPIWLKRNKARIESSTLEIKAREETVEETLNQIEDNVRSIVKELFEIDETYNLYDKTLIQESEQMLSSAYAAYETGKISFLDLLDSERMVVRIRLDFEDIIAKKRITAAKMLEAVGLITLAKE